MPWCEECAKYFAPSAMNEDGTCPACGRVVEEPKVQTVKRSKAGSVGSLADVSELAGEDAKAPWHFKLLMVLLALYLTWRLIDLFR
ncbi:MAG: hypothetical protein R2715_08155 [Ilumatobacteraceae bacterium]